MNPGRHISIQNRFLPPFESPPPHKRPWRSRGSPGAPILVRVMGIMLAALSVEVVMSALDIKPWANLPKP